MRGMIPSGQDSAKRSPRDEANACFIGFNVTSTTQHVTYLGKETRELQVEEDFIFVANKESLRNIRKC